MTRQHFNAIAQTLNAVKPRESDSPQYRQWHVTVYEMARCLAQFNPMFHIGRFTTACGVVGLNTDGD